MGIHVVWVFYIIKARKYDKDAYSVKNVFAEKEELT